MVDTKNDGNGVEDFVNAEYSAPMSEDDPLLMTETKAPVAATPIIAAAAIAGAAYVAVTTQQGGGAGGGAGGV